MHKTTGSEKYRRLLDWLKNARLEQGLTMRDLGALIDEPHSFIQKIESMERKLDVFEYVQYCEALRIRPEKGLELLVD